MTRDLAIAALTMAAVLAFYAATGPRLTVTVAPEIENAAQRIIEGNKHGSH